MRLPTPAAAASALLGLSLALVPVAARADGYSPTGKPVATNLVCIPLLGGYSVYPDGPDFPWVIAYDTQSRPWSAWMSQEQMRVHGFAKRQNPSNPRTSVWVVYARWLGTDWEMVGDWGKVLNARGEPVGNAC